MIERIKQITFNFKEFNPDKKGLYFYENKYFTYREFLFHLRNRLIWFYVNDVEREVLK